MQPTGVVDFVGNRTECALLVMLRKLGVDYDRVRQERGKDQIKVWIRVWWRGAGTRSWCGVEGGEGGGLHAGQ